MKKDKAKAPEASSETAKPAAAPDKNPQKEIPTAEALIKAKARGYDLMAAFERIKAAIGENNQLILELDQKLQQEAAARKKQTEEKKAA